VFKLFVCVEYGVTSGETQILTKGKWTIIVWTFWVVYWAKISCTVFQSLVAALVLMKLDLRKFYTGRHLGFPAGPSPGCHERSSSTGFSIQSIWPHHTAASPPAWLCALERITYMLAVLVYQCICGLMLTYLADTLQPVAQIPGQQRLRSSSTSGCTINMALYDWWPSFPSNHRKNMEQLAVRSDVI